MVREGNDLYQSLTPTIKSAAFLGKFLLVGSKEQSRGLFPTLICMLARPSAQASRLPSVRPSVSKAHLMNFRCPKIGIPALILLRFCLSFLGFTAFASDRLNFFPFFAVVDDVFYSISLLFFVYYEGVIPVHTNWFCTMLVSNSLAIQSCCGEC